MREVPKKLTISWLREQYLKGSLKPAEIVEECVARMDRASDANVWIYRLGREELDGYLKRLGRMNPTEYPLWGIPFAIKDNIDLKGVPTTAGCPKYAYVPKESAEVVRRVIRAGAIPLGKTNLDQFATGLVGTRSPYGEVHNSLRPELISGGSSAGSAVAVALGQAAFSFGTDTAGSGRVPAALNNIIGYKPGVGAWPSRGVVPACASIDCVSAFVNSMEDAAAVDAAVRGLCPGDRWSREIPNPAPALPSRIRIPELSGKDFFGPFASEYRRAWEKTVDSLRALDIPVETTDDTLFRKAAEILYGGPWIAERWSDLGKFVTEHADDVFPVTLQILRSGEGGKYTAAELFTAMHQLQEYRMKVRGLLDDTVYVTPTCAGTWTREQVRNDPAAANTAMGRFTNHCNLLDLCAVAIPGIPAAPDLPFGITVFGLSSREGLALGFSHRYEAKSERTSELVVCGLHMRGLPLEQDLKNLGGEFLHDDRTAPCYRMFCLKTEPRKPGLLRVDEGGKSLAVEVWKLPVKSFGNFALSIPSPLCLGRVILENGAEVEGFLCESFCRRQNEDITDYGGFRMYLRS